MRQLLVFLFLILGACEPTCIEKCDKARLACHAECPSLGSPACSWDTTGCLKCHADCELFASGCASGCGYAIVPDLTTTARRD